MMWFSNNKRISYFFLISGLLLTGCTQEQHPGEVLWEANCKSCHSVGLAGAPIIGNEKMWAKRLDRGMDSIYQHALEGWGDMPARGGNAYLSDEEVKLAVDFMVSKVTTEQ